MDGCRTGGSLADMLGSEQGLDLLPHVAAPPRVTDRLQRVRRCWWTTELTASQVMGCRHMGEDERTAQW